jgi:hypothetical protein
VVDAKPKKRTVKPKAVVEKCVVKDGKSCPKPTLVKAASAG